MGDTVGLTPVPKDGDLVPFIKSLIEDHRELLFQTREELEATIEQTEFAQEPPEFTYAKLLNYLAQGISQPDLINLCAAALWELNENGTQV